MSKAYSNKALPPGTVLREWRLEEVLGVGGFGIVYKGRGIYFDELVAIKEYFPSSISDRDESDTVVPIDSEAEEVHALGLKKFVEEAKLLWNLSTPTRHPNIVSVRSLFEIHGTAYMVMDFEDGIALSRLLKDGRRFNEASLTGLVQPIAEGLDRAHRVGVLHRDIKPPNILVNDDGRPVLIDFGSARFESSDATSTKVTFHTPPYAAIEQYVKTYDQGPWTDIYALGVVLYECITGGKPPEVLERMHGGLDTPLIDREWPGYSHTFLKAVDAAMAIRPSDRPKSIAAWLELFSQPEAAPASAAADDDDDEATRFVTFDTQSRNFVPVAPPPPGFDRLEAIETPVPDDVGEVEFKAAGETTNAGVKTGNALVDPPPVPPPAERTAAPAPPKPQAPGPERKKSSKLPLVLAGVVAAAGAGIAGGWYVLKGGPVSLSTHEIDKGLTDVASAPATAGPTAVASEAAVAGDVPAALQDLAAEARKAGAPADAVGMLTGAAVQPGNGDVAGATRVAGSRFAGALAGDVERRSQRIGHDVPWADPRRSAAAAGESAEQKAIQARLHQARTALGASASAAGQAADPGQAMAYAHQALASWHAFASAQARAYALGTPSIEAASVAQTEGPAAPAAKESSPAPVSTATGVSGGKAGQLATIVSSTREVADRVIRMGRTSKPGSNASKDEKDNYATLQQNAKSAQGYITYLDRLTNSMRGAKDDREADRLIAQGEQTKRYVLLLLSRSTAASR